MSRPSDPLTGVKCFTIGGRMVDRRQRCLGMTDEERKWRAQWLKDQVLSPNEPRDVPEYYKATTNYVRRLWKTPMNNFQKYLEPKLGKDGAYITRYLVGKSVVCLMLLYGGTYFFKYHTNKFERFRSLEIFKGGTPMYPDDPDYPNYPVKKPSEYYDQGFYSSVLCNEINQRLEALQALEEEEEELLDESDDCIPQEEIHK